MSSRAKFSDATSDVTTIPSTWQLDREMVDAEAQTSEHLYQFAESEMQTGIATEMVTDEVKAKYEGMTVLDFMSKKHKRMSKDRWRAAIEKGMVTVANTVDFEVQTNPDSKIAGEYVIEYVNTGGDVGVQTMSIAEVAKESGRSAGLDLSSGGGGRGESKEEGKSGEGKYDEDDEYGDGDFNGEEGKDGGGREESKSTGGSSHPVASFVQRQYSGLIAAALEENNSSAAFDGFADNASSNSGLNDKEVSYWNRLSVDLERKKIVYPDWGKARHYPARVVKTVLTRNKERVYDVEFEDSGLVQQGLREEHIRVLGEPLNLGAGIPGNPGKALNEGMKVHAPVRSKGVVKYLPGRVVAVHGKAPNNSYDVECEGGKVVKGLLLTELVVGMMESQSVEARQPTITPLQATGVSWNSSGSSLGVAFGRTDIVGWCNSPGAVCVWNVFGKEFKADNPDYTLDHASCLMCVAFHPTIPSLVAAGSFNGEVMFWNLAKGADQPAIVSPIAEYTHTEPVTKLSWVKDGGMDGLATGATGELNGGYLLCSSSADGRVLFWDTRNNLKYPVIGGRASRGSGSSNKSSRSGADTYPGTYGVTTVAFSGGLGATMRPQWMIAGQEGGNFLRAQAFRMLSGARLTEGHFGLGRDSTTLHFDAGLYPNLRKGEEAFAHEAHVGSVNGLDFSPFSRNLFLSAGSDGTVHLKHLLEAAPLRSWEPSSSASSKAGSADKGGDNKKGKSSSGGKNSNSPFTPVTGVQFSPTRPLVFAAASLSGSVYLYDLAESENSPAAVLEVAPENGEDSPRTAAGSRGSSSKGKSSSTRGGGGAAADGVAQFTDVAFNRKQRGFIAASDLSGAVHIWRLGWGLTAAIPSEVERLEALESAAAGRVGGE